MTTTVPQRSYQLKITLQASKPMIWRRLLVPSSMTLDQLHDALQAAMGWENAHLHRFDVRGERYGVRFNDENDDYDELLNEAGVRLGQVLVREQDSMVYKYDFGDDWVHAVILEKILDSADAPSTPRCVAGARACPPEDCGGVWGYADLLKALRNPANAEHESMTQWVGEDFDPEDFNMAEINERLSALAVCGNDTGKP